MDVEHLNVVLGAKLGGLRAGLSQADVALAKTHRALAQLEKASGQTTRQASAGFSRTAQQMRVMGASADRSNAQLGRLSRGALAGSGAFRGFARSIAFASTAFIGGAGIAAGISFVINRAATFEKSMNTLQAVTRAVGARFKAAGDLARRLGADIRIPGASAADAAQAMTELAKGGLSLGQAMAATRGTLQLAAAAELGVAEAAKISVSALNAFRLSGDQAGKVADLLAAAANASQGEIADMAYGLQQASAQAHAAGLSVHETVTALTILAKAGIQGSDAGTTLRVMLQRFIPTSTKARDMIRSLGLEVFNARGEMLPLRDIIARYSGVLTQLNPKQRAFVLQTIFGQDAIRASNILLGSSVKEYDAVAKATGTAGEAQRVAGAKMKGMAGAVEAVRNGIDTLGIAIGTRLNSKLEPLLRRFATWVGQLAQSEDFLRKLTSAIDTGSSVVSQIAASLRTVIGQADAAARAFGGWREVLIALASIWAAFKLRAVGSMVAMRVASEGAAARVEAAHRVAATRISAGYQAAASAAQVSMARLSGTTAASTATSQIGTAATTSAAASTVAFSRIGTAALGLSRVLRSALITSGFGLLVVAAGIAAEKIIRHFGLLDRAFGRTGQAADAAAQAVDRLRGTLDRLKQANEDAKDGELDVERATLALTRALKTRAEAAKKAGRDSLAYKEANLGVKQAVRDVEQAHARLSDAQARQRKEAKQQAADVKLLDLRFRQAAQSARDKLIPANTEMAEVLARTGQKSAAAFNREVIDQYAKRMDALAQQARKQGLPVMAAMAEKAAAVARGIQKIPEKKNIALTAQLNKAPLTVPGMKTFGESVGGALGDAVGRSFYNRSVEWLVKWAGAVHSMDSIESIRGSSRAGGRSGVRGSVSGALKGVKSDVVDFASEISGLYGSGLSVMSGFRPGSRVAGSGRVSLHASGNAVDLGPYYGATLTAVGQAALMAAGMPANEARKHSMFYGSVNGWEIIFGCKDCGGDHTNHVHVGKKSATARKPSGTPPAPDLSGMGAMVDAAMAPKAKKKAKGKLPPVVPPSLELAIEQAKRTKGAADDIGAYTRAIEFLERQLEKTSNKAAKLRIAKEINSLTDALERLRAKRAKQTALPIKLEIQIEQAKRTKGTGDDLRAYARAIAFLEAQLEKTSNKVGRLRIEKEITKINRAIERINASRAVAQARRIQAAFDKFMEPQITRGLEGFDRATQRHLRAMAKNFEAELAGIDSALESELAAIDATLQSALAAIDARRAELTPAEGALADFRRARDAQRFAREMEDAQRDLQRAMEGGDAEEIRRAQERIQDLQMDAQERSLEEQARVEREARDKEAEDARAHAELIASEARTAAQRRAEDRRKAAQEAYDEQVQAYQDERDQARKHYEQTLRDFARFLLKKNELAKLSNEELRDWLRDHPEYGIDWEDLPEDWKPPPRGGGGGGGDDGGGNWIPMGKGGEFIARGPTPLIVGEGTRAEHVRVTPLGAGAEQQQQQQAQAQAQPLVINVNGTVIGTNPRSLARELARLIEPELNRGARINSRV